MPQTKATGEISPHTDKYWLNAIRIDLDKARKRSDDAGKRFYEARECSDGGEKHFYETRECSDGIVEALTTRKIGFTKLANALTML